MIPSLVANFFVLYTFSMKWTVLQAYW